MSNQDPPAGTTSLFPDAWIVGRAAASLVRDDEDVLLADDPGPAEPVPVLLREVGTRPRAPLAPSTQELAELRAEMDRLQQRISLHQAARLQSRVRSTVQDADASSQRREAAVEGPDPQARPALAATRSLARNGRRLVFGLLLLMVLLAAAAVGFLVYSPPAPSSPSLGERLQLFKQDVAQRAAGLGARLKALQGDTSGR